LKELRFDFIVTDGALLCRAFKHFTSGEWFW